MLTTLTLPSGLYIDVHIFVEPHLFIVYIETKKEDAK